MEHEHDEAPPADVTELTPEEAPEPSGSYVTEPAKLMRIAAMARAMLTEARAAMPDEAGRDHLKEIYQRTVDELCNVLSDELREELSDMLVPLEEDTPSASEMLIAQAQLVGWLEGLFNGIQAAVMTQQVAAQAQLHEMSQRRLVGGESPGQYL